MDFLFNVIITIAIIIFVMKRMAEVSRKSRDITGPPPPPPVLPGEYIDRAPKIPRRKIHGEEVHPRKYAPLPEETISDQKKRERSIQVRDRLEEARRRFEAQQKAVEAQRKIAEERFEAAQETASGAEYHEPDQAHAPRLKSHRGKKMKKIPGLIPHLTPHAARRGIILSEILGPPVGMRRNDHW